MEVLLCRDIVKYNVTGAIVKSNELFFYNGSQCDIIGAIVMSEELLLYMKGAMIGGTL